MAIIHGKPCQPAGLGAGGDHGAEFPGLGERMPSQFSVERAEIEGQPFEGWLVIGVERRRCVGRRHSERIKFKPR